MKGGPEARKKVDLEEVYDLFQKNLKLAASKPIGLLSTGPCVGGTRGGQGIGDRGPLSPGENFAGNLQLRESLTSGPLSPGVLLHPELVRRGYDVSGAPFAGDLGRGTSFAGD